MHLGSLDSERDPTVLRLGHGWLSVHHLPAPGVGRPVPGPVHRHLDHVLQHGAAQPGGDAGGGAQGGRGVDLQEPGPQVGGEHEVSSVELVTVLTGTAAVHHVCSQWRCEGRINSANLRRQTKQSARMERRAAL